MTRRVPESVPGHGSAVVTGAEDDGRNHLLQLVIGFLGWGLLIALVWYLTVHASAAALDLAVLLVSVITLVAIFWTVTAVQLRSRLIEQRAIEPGGEEFDDGLDTLGRRIEVPTEALSGEIILLEEDGVRRYAPRYGR